MPSSARKLRDALGELAGSGVGAAIDRAFDCMTVAEDEILVTMARHKRQPEVMRRVWNAFGALLPPPGMPERLYPHHCRELLARAVAGCDLRPGTRAEVLYAISTASMASRLSRDVETLGLSIAADFWPAHAADLSPGEESYEGAREETLRELSCKCAVADRKLRDELRDPPAHALAKIGIKQERAR